MPPKNNVNPELDPVIADPANRTCADCDAKAPRWASVNLGILVCIDCSGAHRNLGTHISVVKSVTLDKWQPKWIATVGKIGNEAGNAYYEDRMDSSEKPRESDSLEKKAAFIRKKYENKQFVPRNKPSPSELLGQGRDPKEYCRRGGRDRSASDERRPAARGDDRRQRRRTPSPDERPRRQAANGAPPPKAAAPAPAPAPAPVRAAAPASVDLLGGLDAPAPAPAPAAAAPSAAGGNNWASFGQQPAAQPQQADLSSIQFGAAQAAIPTQAAVAAAAVPGALPDVFTQPAAPAAPQQPPAEQIADQKVDAMKNALASLYHQPPENRYAAFNTPAAGNMTMPGAGMGGMPGMPAMPGMQGMGGMSGMGGMGGMGMGGMGGMM
mmetsp:Transcript_83402/g.210247  ORF Transcript_83402/g.210247 Transcript_83402/m.210247 type:complete len:381 (+) Transcript_83402:217-1359(+)